ARAVGGLAGDLLHHLGAHVLELVLELDLLGDGDAVLGHRRRAEALLDHHVAAARTERHAHRVGERVDADEQLGPRVLVEADLLGSHRRILLYSQMPRTSSSRMMRCSSPSILTSVPEYLLKSTRSPFLISSGWSLPSSSTLPLPTETTLPSEGFSLAVSGMMIPPLVFSSSSMRLTRMRSWSGRIFMRSVPPRPLPPRSGEGAASEGWVRFGTQAIQVPSGAECRLGGGRVKAERARRRAPGRPAGLRP